MAQSRFSPPTSFNSAPLVRLLASFDIANAADSSQTFAERLGLWVAWTDAIALSGALNGAPSAQAADANSGGSGGAVTAIEQFRRVRKDLAESIVHDVMFSGTQVGNTAAAASVTDATDGESDFDFATYRRHYLAHQRSMEERVGELRQQVRTAVSDVSPALGRLAALDAVMEHALAAHQRRVLAKVPGMLERCFKGLRKLRLQAPSQAGDADASTVATRPLNAGQAMQSVLLAELEIRLQPVQGMIEALDTNSTSQT